MEANKAAKRNRYCKGNGGRGEGGGGKGRERGRD